MNSRVIEIIATTVCGLISIIATLLFMRYLLFPLFDFSEKPYTGTWQDSSGKRLTVQFNENRPLLLIAKDGSSNTERFEGHKSNYSLMFDDNGQLRMLVRHGDKLTMLPGGATFTRINKKPKI
ncbi:MAG: hypothetical protein LUF87_01990 [Alistipes sp.]|nr:hypothetical protein [Alistipes sp.]